MAMLAEPRRKQKIGPNPRGKFFLEDEDNKGRALLSKLGWQKGDGLGRQNQGMQAPICPKIQMDGKGLGYDPKSDPWIAHTQEFSQILENLQAVHSVQAEVAGEETPAEDEAERKRKLEKKSKSSRVRIHYHKFVKNKDVSNFSHTDLKCIFGKPSDALLEKPDLEGVNTHVDLTDGGSTEDAVKTINCGSMADYFKKKMEEKGKKVEVKIEEENPNIINRGSMLDYFKAKMEERRLKALQTEQEQVQEKSVVEQEVSKLDNVKSEDTTSGLAEEEPNLETPKKKRKKNKKEITEDSSEDLKPEFTDLGNSETACVIESSSIVSENSLKKKRKKSKEIIQAGTELQSDMDIKPVISELQEISVAEPTKKPKKSKKYQSEDKESEEDISLEVDPVCSLQDSLEASKKSHKSKRKPKEEPDLETTADEPPLKKTKKLKIEPVSILEQHVENDNSQNVSKKDKRKKVKKQSEDCLQEVASEIEPTESKKEKRKKVKEQSGDCSQEVAAEIEATENKKEKRKKVREQSEDCLQEIVPEVEAPESKKEKKSSKRLREETAVEIKAAPLKVEPTGSRIAAEHPKINGHTVFPKKNIHIFPKLNRNNVQSNKNFHKSSESNRSPAPAYIPLTKTGKVDKRYVTSKDLHVISKNFPGSNLNKLNGYALY